MRTFPRRAAWLAAALALVLLPSAERGTGDANVALKSAASLRSRAPEYDSARLSDAEYWRLVTTLSEPDGQFHSENFVSNEGTFQRLIVPLQQRVAAGGVYLGVGPEQNFSYIAALKPRIAFIVDIRRQNMIQHLMYKAIFEQSPTRADFFSLLFSRPKPETLGDDVSAQELFETFLAVEPSLRLFRENLAAAEELLVSRHGFGLSKQDLASLEHVYNAFFRAGPLIRYTTPLAGGGGGAFATLMQVITTPDETGVNRSFLGNEENYRLVRHMHQANLIIPVVGDFAGPKALRAVGEHVRSMGATVSAFYVSNVESYLFRNQEVSNRFYRNVESLPLDSASIFIRPPSGTMSQRALPQHLMVEDASGKVVRLGIARRTGAQGGFSTDGANGQSALTSISQTLKAVHDGRVRRYSDLFRLER